MLTFPRLSCQGRAEGHTIEEMLASYAKVQAAVKEAQRILILGGGPVGVEMAGEIHAYFPDKKVTLVNSGVSEKKI